MHNPVPDARNATGSGFLEPQISLSHGRSCVSRENRARRSTVGLYPDSWLWDVVESRVETVTLGGDQWRAVGEYPRLIAESFRRLLERYGVPSMVRTPFQWVQSTPVIEIETGGYMGMVQMFVPESMYDEAMHLLEREATDAEVLENDEIHMEDTLREP